MIIFFQPEENETPSVPKVSKNIPALQLIRGHRHVITYPTGVYLNFEVVVNGVYWRDHSMTRAISISVSRHGALM
jgi:hypothetical protein